MRISDWSSDVCSSDLGQNVFLLKSDRLGHWEEGEKPLEPVYPWELVQIGNCGSPIELDEGWLLLTHGVGAMRKYSIGAVLLDKEDPSKVIARSRKRSEEHTSELQSLMRISYAVFCLKK